MKLCLLGGLGGLALAVAGCGGPGQGKVGSGPTAPPTTAKAGASCLRAAPAAAFQRLSEARQSGTLALARMGSRTVAFVADEDTRTLFTIDVDKKTEVAATPLPGAPSHVILTADGRVLVGIRDQAEIVVLEPSVADAPLATRCAVDTAAEPVAMALTPDDATLLVSSGWGSALAALDAKTMARKFEVSLPREPRAVIVSDDGKDAIVAHAVGARLTRVNLADDKHATSEIDLHPRTADILDRMGPRNRETACQTYALAKSTEPRGRILAPQVVVDPGDLEGRPTGYGDANTPTESPDVAVIDDTTFEALAHPANPMARTLIEMSRGRQPEAQRSECLLPRAAAMDPASGSILVTCYGIDQLVAYDAASGRPAQAERRRWTVGGGPSGVDVDSANARAVVWSQFDRAIQVVSLRGLDQPIDDKGDKRAGVERFALAKPKSADLPHEIALGRQLFNAVGDSRISHDGRACASCHPDGRDDAIVWATPDGPRRTAMLAGRLQGTAPYGWSGSGKDLDEHLSHTFDRLTGHGLTSVELSSLIAYVSTLRPPQPAATETAKIARGGELFRSASVGCASCHGGDALTDNKSHDIGSKTKNDKTKEFDTPSLRFVAKRSPYFHDGRYTTLRELLRGADGTMGHTGQLSLADLEALEAYLRSL